MIRIAMAAAAAAALASACGGTGGDKAAIVAACTKDGQSQKSCDCIATEFEKTLDKDAFHVLALGAQGKQEEADKLAEAMPMDKKMAMAASVMGVMAKCGPALAN